MNFKTQPDSKVFLLAYDKRLINYFQGNEVKKDNVHKTLADFDGSKEIISFHMNEAVLC